MAKLSRKQNRATKAAAPKGASMDRKDSKVSLTPEPTTPPSPSRADPAKVPFVDPLAHVMAFVRDDLPMGYSEYYDGPSVSAWEAAQAAAENPLDLAAYQPPAEDNPAIDSQEVAAKEKMLSKPKAVSESKAVQHTLKAKAKAREEHSRINITKACASETWTPEKFATNYKPSLLKALQDRKKYLKENGGVFNPISTWIAQATSMAHCHGRSVVEDAPQEKPGDLDDGYSSAGEDGLSSGVDARDPPSPMEICADSSALPTDPNDSVTSVSGKSKFLWASNDSANSEQQVLFKDVGGSNAFFDHYPSASPTESPTKGEMSSSFNSTPVLQFGQTASSFGSISPPLRPIMPLRRKSPSNPAASVSVDATFSKALSGFITPFGSPECTSSPASSAIEVLDSIEEQIPAPELEADDEVEETSGDVVSVDVSSSEDEAATSPVEVEEERPEVEEHTAPIQETEEEAHSAVVSSKEEEQVPEEKAAEVEEDASAPQDDPQPVVAIEDEAGAEDVAPKVGPCSFAAKDDKSVLKYQFCRTYIGSGCLEDFLELLDLDKNNKVKLQNVAEAFITLARDEGKQMLGDKTGSTFKIPDDAAAKYKDVLLQIRVKLGSISLKKFLGLLDIDEEGNIDGLSVVEAFVAASKMDTAMEEKANSKAAAFRSMMVERGI